MSVTADSGGQRIFLRKASGLIRTASMFDTFVFNIGLVSVGLGIGTMLFYGPPFYPGGDMALGSIIVGIAMAFVCWGFIHWSVVLPRSGGTYVFASRILPPWAALAISFGDLVAPLFYAGIAAYWILKIGLAPVFAMIGYAFGAQWALDLSVAITQPWALFIIGSGILILCALLIASGMKLFLTVHKIVFILSLLGSLLMIVILLFSSNEEFIAQFNALMGASVGVPDPYNAIIESGKSLGWTTENATFSTTMGVSNWAWLPMIGAAYSFAIGGEIKSVAKAQTWGMLGAVIVTTAIWVVTIWLANSVIGYDFLGTVLYNYFQLGGEGLTMPTDPSIALLTGILTGSAFWTFLLGLGIVLWMWMWLPGIQTFCVRAMVAWSFDRVAPDALGTVSQTRHTPTVAIIVTLIIELIFLALFCFAEYFTKIVILIEAQTLAWAITLAAGAFFPYYRSAIYQKSPLAKQTILGLPAMTVSCTLGALASLFYLVALWNDDVAAGHAPDQVAIVIGTFVAGAVFYFIMKAYRASKGIDVSLAFKEIPIE
ncbi:MAG: amino acid permease [Dongiaceae bacterium]